jgi:excisionase family DNA binding protein
VENNNQEVKLLTRKEVASMLRIALPTLDRILQKNEIKYTKVNRQVRIKYNDVLEYIK